MPNQHVRWDLKYQLLVSAIGLFLVFMLTVYPPAITADLSWRKPVIGFIFGTFCFLGVLAVFSPNQCGKLINIKKKTSELEPTGTVSHYQSTVLKGHHPTCGKYGAHVIQIRDKTFCAACIGLFVGGIVALAGTVVYFFCHWPITEHATSFVLLGITFVGLGLFQFKFRSSIRLLTNTVFVLGALLILVGIDGLVHNLFFDLFIICLIVFWLLVRISLSQWDHEMICSGCKTENCGVREQKKREKS